MRCNKYEFKINLAGGYRFKEFPKLQETKQTEVCIVGAGLTGITAAIYFLKKE